MSPQTAPESSCPTRGTSTPPARGYGSLLRRPATALAVAGLIVTGVSVVATPADALRTYASTATVRYTASAVSSGTASRPVSASATVGSPPVVRSRSGVAKVTRYARAGKTVQVRIHATGASTAQAKSLATKRARAAAARSAVAGAKALAHQRAVVAAKRALPPVAQTLWRNLYSGALTDAKSARKNQNPSGTPTTPPSSTPTSSAPTSSAPTSSAPTSSAPTSSTPTSSAPTSSTPTSSAPTSSTPTSSSSSAPTSSAPTSSTPTSSTPASSTPTSSTPAPAPVTGPTFSTSTPGTTVDAPVSNCGDTIYKDDGTAWSCTFDDEFTGNTLDPTKWTAWNNANWWGGQDICFYDDPSHVAVDNGALNLSVTRMSPSSSCWTNPAGTAPLYGGGVVNTKDKFTQTYGLFEARIKFGGGKGVHDDFWLYPQDATDGSRAEIDVAEPFGVLPNTMFGATHMADDNGNEAGKTGMCDVANWADQYHIYGVKWSPSAITFIVDGQTCYTYSNWTPRSGSTSAGAPFNKDFFMILEATVDDGTWAPAPDASTPLPSTTSVDWVRVWK